MQDFGPDDEKKDDQKKLFNHILGDQMKLLPMHWYYIITYGNTGCSVFKQGVQNWNA